MGNIRQDFASATFASDWQRAFYYLNGMSMTDMLNSLEGLQAPILNQVISQRANYANGVNMPRIEYALFVVQQHSLPSSAPGDLSVTGQVQDARNFLQSSQGPAANDHYTGSEPSIDLPTTPPPEDLLVYAAASPHVPPSSKPIYDDDSGAVIGFMYSSLGYYAFYDLTGNLVASDEISLEQPLVDPLDFVMLIGGVARGVARTAIAIGLRAAASGGIKLTLRALTATVLAGMRGAFRAAISVRTLKFTATTASRMATKGRYVPLHMLKMAIRFGAREADPQEVKGAFQYTLKLIRSDPHIAPGLSPAASWAGKTYTLKVVVKEELTSNTVLHFHYD
jgi:hypothetical protein